MRTNKIESFIGIALLIIVIVAFVTEIIFQLPKSTEVQSRAQTIPAIPQDLFSASSPINKQIQQLTVPANAPVTVGGGDVGRGNVFTNY